MPITIAVLAALSSSENFKVMFEEIIMVCKAIDTCFNGQFFSWKLLE